MIEQTLEHHIISKLMRDIHYLEGQLRLETKGRNQNPTVAEYLKMREEFQTMPSHYKSIYIYSRRKKK